MDGRGLADFREIEFLENELLFPNSLYGVKVNVPDSKNSILFGINANIVNISEKDEEN